MGWSILGDDELAPERRIVAPPFRRGTFDIFFECFVTLLLCLWTALHLNIPVKYKHETKRRGKFLRLIPVKKLKYLLIGLIAPEIITAISIWQWWTTRLIWNSIQGTSLVENKRKSLRPQDEETILGLSYNGQSSQPNPAESEHALQELPAQGETGRQRQHLWTKTHCWYAAIGGFAFEDYKGTILPFPRGLARMSLHPVAIEHFASEHPEVFPDISESAIRDKSKANDVTKLIVCAQALWFCLNVLGRILAKYPLTLLEVNTAAHCLCTLITYIFWWHKPYDVTESTSLILDEQVAAEAAFLCLASHEGRRLRVEIPPLRLTVFSLMRWLGSKSIDMSPISQAIESGIDIHEWLKDEAHHDALRFSYTTGCHDAEMQEDFLVRSVRGDFTIPYARDYQELLRMAVAVDSQHLAQSDGLKMELWKDDANPFRCAEPSRAEMSWRFLFSQNPIRMKVLVCLACLLYGAVHLLAWHGPFPSTKEKTFWYLGSFAAAPYISLMTVFCMWWAVMTESAKENWLEAGVTSLTPLMRVLLLAMSFALLCTPLFFVITRAFLTIEPYLALGYAPDRAFEVPRWLSYIPHIG